MKNLKFIALLIPVYFAISYMSISEDTLINIQLCFMWIAFVGIIYGLLLGVSKLKKLNQ